MFFKNLKMYRLTKEVNFHNVDVAMASKQFIKCEPMQQTSSGWVMPLGKKGLMLTYEIGNYIMMCMCSEEKILPSSVINDQLEEALDKIEDDTGQRPAGKHKQSLKDSVIINLLPKAFSRKTLTYAYIDLKNQMIIVDSSSSGKAEEVVELLRETIGSLPVTPLKSSSQPMTVMTGWIESPQTSGDFSINDECELIDESDGGAIIKAKNEDLFADEIQRFIELGLKVKKISVTLNDATKFIIEDDLSIKRLKFSDELLDGMYDQSEDDDDKFEVDFRIMTKQVSVIIENIDKSFKII